MIDDTHLSLMIRFYKAFLKKQKFLFAEYGLSEHHLVYLTVINSYPEGVRLIDLTKFIDVDKSSTTRIVKKLEADGCIERDMTKAGERKYKVRTTSKGKSIVLQITEMENKSKIVDELNFNEEEKKKIIELCKAIIQELE